MRSTGWPTTFSWSMAFFVAGWSNFMAQPFASASTEASVRSTSGTLNAFSCVVRAPATSADATALAPRGILALGGLDAPGLVRHAAQRDPAGPIALDDRGDGDEREGVGRPVAHLAIECVPPSGLGSVTAVISSPAFQRVLDVRRVARQPVEIGDRNGARAPFGRTVSTVASSARIATAMSLGCVAMQASLTPTMACCRLNPPIAAQPLPGRRLLHGWLVS